MSLSDTETRRGSGSVERHRWPEMPAAGEHSGRTAPSRAAFWLVAGVLCLLFFGAAAPTPLYGIYRAQLGFSATTLTAVFAIYALVLLLTLLVVGSVSDYLGRRRVILTALLVTAGAYAVFLVAHSVGLLFAARALQGVGVGTATGALGAALIDLQPEGSGLGPLITAAAPALGLGAGALGTGALAQYGSAPTRLVWWLLLGANVAAAAGILAMPEPGTRRAGILASLRPRVGVPRRARATFATAVPCLIAVWALAGLYQSLGPALAVQVTGSRDLVWGGLLVFLLTGNFLGLSIPALIAGVATTHVGLHRTALAYCVAVAALVAVAAGSLMVRRRGPATGQGTS